MNDFDNILPGDPLEGGFFGGRIVIEGVRYALIVAPKAVGEHKPTVWIGRGKSVPNAVSYNDGLANTRAMAEAGSALAQWALNLTIGGHSDWYIDSVDEKEVIYRSLKPTTEKNWCYYRSGINLSTNPPHRPYTPDLPQQTLSAAFRDDGAEAFDSAGYWSSTQHESYPGLAWRQDFSNGYQGYWGKDGKLRARAVRRLPI